MNLCFFEQAETGSHTETDKTPSSFWTPGSEGQIGEIVLNNVGHLIWAAATTEAQWMETFLDDMLKKKHISGF